MAKKHFLVSLFIVQSIFLFSQYSVQVGTPYHSLITDMPVNNEYDYGWSSTIYHQDEINVHGDITRLFYDANLIGFGGPGVYAMTFNQRIFMKLTDETGFSSSSFPDTTGMTLVYAGRVDWYNVDWTEIVLDLPFPYDNTKNLQILYVNMDGSKETDPDYRVVTTHDNTSSVNRTIYNHGDGTFPSGDGTAVPQFPVTYLRFSSGLDVGISAVNNHSNDILAGPNDLSVRFRNYMSDTITSVDINWSLDGVPQTPVQWTGELFPGKESSEVVLDQTDIAPGSFTLEARTSAPNGGSDELPDNDAMGLTIHAGNYIEISAEDYSFQHAPVRTDMKYGWSTSIYPADSVGTAGIITGMAYRLATNPTTLPGQKLFLSTTSELRFSSVVMPDEEGMQTVYDGTAGFTGTGWNTLVFDTVFLYSDKQNIQVLYQNRSGESQTLTTYFHKHNRTASSVFNHNDAAFPTSGGIRYDAAPNVRFYFALPNDAALASVDAPYVTTAAGNQAIRVSIENRGSEMLGSADIHYQVDGGSTEVFHWTGDLAFGESAEALLGDHDFGYGAHTLKVWTSAPNGYNDYANENDTLEMELYAGSPLMGTYTVGSAPSDFSTLREAVDSLNAPSGIGGPVILEIKPGTYSSQYTLGEIHGSSPEYTVTIRSQSGDPADVVISTDSTDYLVKLDGTDHIRFENLTFRSDQAEQSVVITNGSNHNVFTGNRFEGTEHTQNLILSPQESGSVDSFNRFTGNHFTGSHFAMRLFSDGSLYEKGNVIKENTFENQRGTSIGLSRQEELVFRDNTIHNESAYALNADYLNRASFTGNRIRSGGVYQYPVKFGANADTTLIANNFFICRETTNGAVSLSGTRYIFVHNSVVSSGTGFNAALWIAADDKLIFNNILVNEEQGNALYISPGFSNNVLDYNCYHVPEGGYIASESYATLAEWQTASGQDAHSIDVKPLFASENDLHTFSRLLDGSGKPVAGITTDIDGEPRDPATPDIGADEFSSPCTGPLSGTYTIGPSGDYTSFHDAVTALHACGVDGPVSFTVADGTYREQVEIRQPIPGYTKNDSIVFASASGDSTAVILTHEADADKNYTLKLDGADRITFRQMTLRAGNPEFGRVLEITGGANHNRFAHNRFEGTDADSESIDHALIYSEKNSAADSGNVFSYNFLMEGSYGFYYAGNPEASGPQETSTEITGNIIEGQSAAGLHLEYQQDALIRDNRISLQNSEHDLSGIALNDGSRNTAVISGNHIHVRSANRVYGMHVAGLDTGFISNNFISVSATDQNAYGIYSLVWNTVCFHNSVLAYDSKSSVVLDLSEVSPDPVIRNNAFVNLAGGLAVRCSWGAPDVEMDYNNLYSSGSLLGHWNRQDIQSLDQWRTVTGLDSHSVSADPLFNSSSDLHTDHVLLDGHGTPLAEVTADIDGEPRDDSSPDIGADEFDNPSFELGEEIRGCVDAQVTVNAGVGFDSYTWSTGSDSSSVVLDSTGTGYGRREIWVTVSLEGVEYHDSITAVFSSPVANPVENYCMSVFEDSIMISAGEGISYYWSTGDTTQSIYITGTGYYDVTVTDDFGCQDHGTIHVWNNTCPANLNLLPDMTVPADTTLELTASVCGPDYAAYSYQWNTGDTTHAITVRGADYGPGTQEFAVMVINESIENCVSSDTVRITFQDQTGILTGHNNDIRVYPNPTGGIFVVEGNTLQGIELYNLQGKKLFEENHLNHFEVDLSGQPEGIYLLRVLTSDQYVWKKIIRAERK